MHIALTPLAPIEFLIGMVGNRIAGRLVGVLIYRGGKVSRIALSGALRTG